MNQGRNATQRAVPDLWLLTDGTSSRLERDLDSLIGKQTVVAGDFTTAGLLHA